MKLIRNVFFRVQNRIDETLSSFSSVAKQIIVIGSTVIALFWLSVFFYGTFYYYYVPVVAQEKAVYFRFRVCDNGIGMCSFPVANISLAREGQSEVFKRGQIYKLILDMDLPESEVNRNLGMFMVEMNLYNKTGETVQTAAKSGTLLYKSSLLQVLETLVFSPLYLFGYMQQKQSLHVEMFSAFKDHPYNPCVGTVLKVNSLKVEIYTATLKTFAQFSGIRYFLFYWPVTAAIVGISWNFIVQWYFLYYWPVTAAIVGISWNFVLLLFIALLSWYAFRPDDGSPEDCKQVVKIDLPRKRRHEGTPRQPRKAVTDHPGTPETVGDPRDDPEKTSLLRAPDTTDDDSLLRQRQQYTAK